MSEINPIETHEEPSAKQYAPPAPTIKDCIQVNQRMPVNKIDKNIEAISSIIYDKDDLLNEFLQKTDNRLTISKEDPKGEFIKCEQNRDGDSYRSPLSNKYFPPQSDCKFPSKELRELEEKLNQIFHIYVKNYYAPTANCSVFCWDLGSSIKAGFGCSILIKNSVQAAKKEGTWDSNNVLTVTYNEKGGKVYGDYKLTTTVMLSMAFENPVCGKVDLSGTISRHCSANKILPKGYNDHEAQIENVGSVIEDMETNLRNCLDTIYVMKSKEIIDTARDNPNMSKQGKYQTEDVKKAFLSVQGK